MLREMFIRQCFLLSSACFTTECFAHSHYRLHAKDSNRLSVPSLLRGIGVLIVALLPLEPLCSTEAPRSPLRYSLSFQTGQDSPQCRPVVNGKDERSLTVPRLTISKGFRAAAMCSFSS